MEILKGAIDWVKSGKGKISHIKADRQPWLYLTLYKFNQLKASAESIDDPFIKSKVLLLLYEVFDRKNVERIAQENTK